MYYTLHHCNEPTTSSRITLHDRIIQAISKNVIANNTALVEQYIPIHKPPHFGVVVAGLEVIQPTLGIVIISSVPNGVDMGDVVCIGDGVAACIGDQEQLAPGIVGVITNGAGVLVPQADDVTLQVVHIVIIILRGVAERIGDEGRDTVRRAGGIVDVLDLNGRNRFTVQGGDSALTQRRTACRVVGDIGDAAVGIGDGLSGADAALSLLRDSSLYKGAFLSPIVVKTQKRRLSYFPDNLFLKTYVTHIIKQQTNPTINAPL